ncbi:hypothetical protein BU17DRAFT_49126 [Hysterangium stoloniferum]|nr:hypothetical protein BU17DRAFT_49126 [Hysterangium stoloniferum]
MSFYVFSLPKDLLDTLTLRTLVGAPPRAPSPTPIPKPSIPSAPSGSKSCNICLGASFADVDDQRLHFRSDWHRYNVKLRLRGEDVVNEARFASLVEGLDDSLSGSASSSEEESDDSPDAVRALLAKSNNPLRPESPTSYGPRQPRTALTWFHSPPSTQIAVYNAIFPRNVPEIEHLSSLRDMQRGGPYGRRWTLLMVAGGHFAGLIVQVHQPDEEDITEPTVGKKKKKQRPKPEVHIIKHKTFHRYTTRRKQGGSQSVNDNAKGNAKSAGAQLRRYGEQALRDDIRNLMTEWAEDIAECDLIFIRASVSNKRIFYDYDEASFTKDDTRLRTFPFPTRRPTQSELTRCLNELTHVKISHLTEEALHAQDEAYLASLPKPKVVPVPPPPPVSALKQIAPRLSKEEEARREKWERLIDMATKGRMDAFQDLWQREGATLGGINARVPERDVTLLQLAAQAGQEDITQLFLEEYRADPTIPLADGVREYDHGEPDTPDAAPIPAASCRVAYDLAKTRGVRNVFRRCAAAHPDWWDWLGSGHVPSVLSQEMEQEQDERKKVKRKGLKDKIRERQSKQEDTPVPVIQPEPQMVTRAEVRDPVDGPRRLGGAAGGQDGTAGLNAEMRAKVERERRARAAEARLKALGP